MKKSIAICLPSILDENLISQTAKSIRKNIVDQNKDIDFNIFVNIDNYQRPGGSGTKDSVAQIYVDNFVSSNCKPRIISTGKRLGLNIAYGVLIQEFYNSDSEFCVFFDDDHFIINPIDLSSVYEKLKSEKIMLHLSCGKKEQDDSFSYESPFLEDNEVYRDECMVMFSNNRNFYTLPGTFLDKAQASLILSNINFGERQMIEDLIPNTLGNNLFKDYNLYTAFSNKENLKITPGEKWCAPVDCHFAYDSIRACSGYNGVDLRDYNPS